MCDFIVGFYCDVYVRAGNEADAIERASYGMKGYPELVFNVHTGETHYLPRKGS